MEKENRTRILREMFLTLLKSIERILNRLIYPSIAKSIREELKTVVGDLQEQAVLCSGHPEALIQLYLLQHYHYYNEGHFHVHYPEWRMKRISKILEIFGVEYFKGKKLLELGGGEILVPFSPVWAHKLCPLSIVRPIATLRIFGIGIFLDFEVFSAMQRKISLTWQKKQATVNSSI